ncbi:MAG: hemerythrin domain-containing protein [Acidimicrobiales bacterium]
MDAITLLRDDHKTVEKLFRRFEGAGPNAHVERRDLMDRIVEELSRHAAIEEQIFYPATRATVPDVEDQALESIEEHNVVKVLLAELRGMDPEQERFVPKATVLIELVRHHVEEEEQDYFPAVREELGTTSLRDLGSAMEELKANAPTRPHPELPDSPPGNALLAPAAAVVDRVSDLLSGSAQGAFAGLEDLIAQIRDEARPSARPTGSSTAKRQARRVRSRVDDVGTKAVRSASKAGRTEKKASRSAAGKASRSGAGKASRSAGAAAKKASKSGASVAKGNGRASKTAKAGKRTAKKASRSAGSASKTSKRTTKKAARSAA